MKRRYVVVLLWALPALLASVIISALAFGAAAGVLWLFVFGDEPWPSSAGPFLVALFALVCVALWAAFGAMAFAAGKKQEARATLDARHVAAAAGATLLLVLLVVSHQWGVGNIGTPSDGVLCSQYCRAKGFAGSGMPPRDSGERTCRCSDAQGRESEAVPIEKILAERPH
jgi:hypothetical protein